MNSWNNFIIELDEFKRGVRLPERVLIGNGTGESINVLQITRNFTGHLGFEFFFNERFINWIDDICKDVDFITDKIENYNINSEKLSDINDKYLDLVKTNEDLLRCNNYNDVCDLWQYFTILFYNITCVLKLILESEKSQISSSDLFALCFSDTVIFHLINSYKVHPNTYLEDCSSFKTLNIPIAFKIYPRRFTFDGMPFESVSEAFGSPPHSAWGSVAWFGDVGCAFVGRIIANLSE
jgi:hypothetical protein